MIHASPTRMISSSVARKFAPEHSVSMTLNCWKSRYVCVYLCVEICSGAQGVYDPELLEEQVCVFVRLCVCVCIPGQEICSGAQGVHDPELLEEQVCVCVHVCVCVYLISSVLISPLEAGSKRWKWQSWSFFVACSLLGREIKTVAAELCRNSSRIQWSIPQGCGFNIEGGDAHLRTKFHQNALVKSSCFSPLALRCVFVRTKAKLERGLPRMPMHRTSYA
jgi:hypothetical protein